MWGRVVMTCLCLQKMPSGHPRCGRRSHGRIASLPLKSGKRTLQCRTRAFYLSSGLPRAIELRNERQVVARPKLARLHHRYRRAARDQCGAGLSREAREELCSRLHARALNRNETLEPTAVRAVRRELGAQRPRMVRAGSTRGASHDRRRCCLARWTRVSECRGPREAPAMRFMNGEDGAPVRNLMMYLSVGEAEDLVFNLNYLLRDPEALEHDHCYDHIGGFEMAFSIITPTKLSNMSVYTERERALLAGEFDETLATQSALAGRGNYPFESTSDENHVYPSFLHLFNGPVMTHRLDSAVGWSNPDPLEKQRDVAQERRLLGRFMFDGDMWAVERCTPFESLLVAAATVRFTIGAEPFVRVTDESGRSFLELPPLLLAKATTPIAQIRLPKAN